MSLYRCFLINAENHIIEPATEIEASHDDAAIAHARRLCENRPECADVEVWCGAKRVGNVKPAA